MRLKLADNENMNQAAELGGLGVLAAPSAAHLVEHAGGHLGVLGKALTHPIAGHGIELAGLGILAVPSVAHFGQKLLGKKSVEPKVACISPTMLAYFFKEAAILLAASPADKRLNAAGCQSTRVRVLAMKHPEIVAEYEHLAKAANGNNAREAAFDRICESWYLDGITDDSAAMRKLMGDIARLKGTLKVAAVFSVAERRAIPAKEFAVSKRLAKKSGDQVPKKEKGMYPISDLCLCGDTKISLLNGTEREIQDLVGEDVWVYSYNLEKRAIVPALATDVRCTMEAAPVIRVALDNGEAIVCTENHPFLLRSGEYRQAGELTPGDSLMPLYRKLVHQQNKEKDYEKVYQPWFRHWEFTHHMSCREYNSKPLEDGNVVHHENKNQLDNEPGNLWEMTREDHCSLHAERQGFGRLDALARGSARRWKDPMALAEMGSMMRTENAHRVESGKIIDISAKIAEKKRKLWEDPIFREKTTAAIRKAKSAGRSAVFDVESAHYEYLDGASLEKVSRKYGVSKRTLQLRFKKLGLPSRSEVAGFNNHKVMSITPAGTADVYDLTINGTHNFALSAGVFVHNSHARSALAFVSRYGTPAEKEAVRARVHAAFPGIEIESK